MRRVLRALGWGAAGFTALVAALVAIGLAFKVALSILELIL